MFNFGFIRVIFLLHEERRHFEGVYKCKAIQFWASEVFLAAWMFRVIINSLTHSLTAALDQLRVVASSTSNDPGPRSRQHQQIGQCLLPLATANFSVDDPAGASSQQREECRCGLLLAVEVPVKQVCSPVGDICDQIMNDVCQQ